MQSPRLAAGPAPAPAPRVEPRRRFGWHGVPSYARTLFEAVENFRRSFVRTQLPRDDLVQPLVDQLLGPCLFPDPLPGGAIHDFAGAIGEPAPAALLQLPGMGEVFMMPIEC